jgi:hypothetical protein
VRLDCSFAPALFLGQYNEMPSYESDIRVEGLERLLQSECTPEQACHEVARVFSVRDNEVALFVLQDGALRFLCPRELKASGQIPLSSSGVAPRTARKRKTEFFNKFPQERHHSFFESVRLNSPEGVSEILPQTIQKLMSAPLIGPGGNVVGVVQISRKGDSPKAAGADFSEDDLKLLDQLAGKLALLVAKVLA